MRFLIAFLTALAALATLYLAAGRLVDPRGDFDTKIFPVIISDARKTKMEQFTRYLSEGPVDGIVVGSSRSMKLQPRVLERVFGGRFFNFSVDSARTEDYLAVYRWVRAQGARPRFVIVGLDVEALHDDDVADSRLESNFALKRALEGREPSLRVRVVQGFRKYKGIFTDSYAEDAITSVRVLASRARLEARASFFEPDGYLRYPISELERARGTFDLEAEIGRCLPKYVTRFDGMHGLSSRRKAYLDRLIPEAEGDGASVIVWVTSLHPETARYLAERTRYPALLKDVEDYLGELHARYAIEVYDFSDPQRFGGTLTGWYDCAHIDESNAALVAASLARKAS